MAKITNIDKATAIMLGDEVMREAEKIAAKYGLQVKRGGGRYGEGVLIQVFLVITATLPHS
jgi:hypothetical protein